MTHKTKIAAGVLMISVISAFAQIPLKPGGTQAQLNLDLITVYNDYKSEFLKPTPSGNYYIEAKGTGQDGARCATQSEAHGYGMMIFALAEHDADSKKIFDGMNQLRKAHPSNKNPALMSWIVFPEHTDNTNPSQTPSGQHNGDPGRRSSATDGDLDMAYALLLAYTRWGQQSYLDEAKSVIAAIKSDNMHSSTLRTNLGDWAKEGSDGMSSRPSDWMPGHFRAFYKATNDNFWLQAADTVYALIDQLNAYNSNSNTGLIPDFATGSPCRPDPDANADENDNFVHYSYNACRVPWRIATDFVHHQTPKAEIQLNKISSWLRSATGSNPGSIMGGYKLDGTPLVSSAAGMPFVAPFAAGMLADAANQNFLNATWGVIKNARTSSYGAGIQLLCMYLITGNWKAPLEVIDGKFPVTVMGGSGSGRFAPGEKVDITATVPAGRKFKNWTSSSGISFANANSAATSFTMPEKAVFITANFEVTDYTLASNLAYWENWKVEGNLAPVLSVTPNSTSGKVAFNMQTSASDDWNNNHAWADVLCEFSAGDFNNVSSIELTYTSNSALNFVLIDNGGWSKDGLGFTYELPRATTPNSLTINLSQFSRRNSWSSDGSTQFKNSDRAFIRGVLFGIGESSSASGEITNLIINDLKVDGSTSIFIKSSVEKQQHSTVSIANGSLNFNVSGEKAVSVRICDIRGRLLYSKDITLNSGVASIALPTNLIGKQTLILNVKGQNGLNLSRKILVK